MEAVLGLYILSVGNYVPRLDVGEEQVDSFIVVAGIFPPLLLNVLRFNDLFDGGDSAGVDGLLEVILLIECLLVLL